MKNVAPRVSITLAILFGISVVSCYSYVYGQTEERNTNVVQLDKSSVLPVYANFARVTATPDEVIIDLGMSVNVNAEELQDIKVHHESVMNFYTLKRLAKSLETTIARHEEVFGPIELDINKRVKQ
jgi:hypothetical protein